MIAVYYWLHYYCSVIKDLTLRMLQNQVCRNTSVITSKPLSTKPCFRLDLPIAHQPAIYSCACSPVFLDTRFVDTRQTSSFSGLPYPARRFSHYCFQLHCDVFRCSYTNEPCDCPNYGVPGGPWVGSAGHSPENSMSR